MLFTRDLRVRDNPALAGLDAPLAHAPWLLPAARRGQLGYPGPIAGVAAA